MRKSPNKCFNNTTCLTANYPLEQALERVGKQLQEAFQAALRWPGTNEAFIAPRITFRYQGGGDREDLGVTPNYFTLLQEEKDYQPVG